MRAAGLFESYSTIWDDEKEVVYNSLEGWAASVVKWEKNAEDEKKGIIERLLESLDISPTMPMKAG
jgi:hypothetical protein